MAILKQQLGDIWGYRNCNIKAAISSYMWTGIHRDSKC